MGKKLNIFTLLVICLCGLHSAFAQQNQISFKDFSELKNKANQFREGRSYRSKTTTEFYDKTGTNLKRKHIMIREILPPDRRYVSSTVEAAGVTIKAEFISIGEKTFIKNNGGKWEVLKAEEVTRREMIGLGSMSGDILVEEATYDNQAVKIYLEKSSSYVEDKETDQKTKYWITLGGELLKTEREETDRKTGEISRETTTYEYDSNIKIEAPIK